MLCPCGLDAYWCLLSRWYDRGGGTHPPTQATVGNGIIAIVAGVVAEYAASEYGYQAPFVVAIIPLSILAVTVSSTWSENYGDQKIAASAGFGNAWTAIMSDKKVMWLGLAQSGFEGTATSTSFCEPFSRSIYQPRNSPLAPPCELLTFVPLLSWCLRSGCCAHHPSHHHHPRHPPPTPTAPFTAF